MPHADLVEDAIIALVVLVVICSVTGVLDWVSRWIDARKQ